MSTTFTAKGVKNIVATYMLNVDQAKTSSAVVVALGVEFGQDSSTGSLFDGQVKRALVKLVDEGVLVRRKQRFVGYAKRAYVYESKAKAEARIADRERLHQEQLAAEKAQKEQETALVSAFDSHGISAVARGGLVSMSLGQAGKLVDLLEAGRNAREV